jgi:hypothetical protein
MRVNDMTHKEELEHCLDYIRHMMALNPSIDGKPVNLRIVEKYLEDDLEYIDQPEGHA